MKFDDVSKKFGLDNKTFSNGSAYGDFDNDGDLDLVVNNVNMISNIYENKSTNNWISFSFDSSSKNNSSFGLEEFNYSREDLFDSFTKVISKNQKNSTSSDFKNDDS